MRSALLALALLSALACAPASAAQYDPWPDLVTNVFDGRTIEDGAGIVALDAPYRAEDAAVVPMTIRSELPDGSPRRIEKLTLVIDNNPSPVAAVFTLGDAGTVKAISTRVRVNAYTNVHLVAELDDGKLYGVAKFVKASGGCSAPSLKDPTAVAHIGELKFRRFDGEAPAGLDDAQIMIRHPNNSGLQMDPLTMYYIPAFFIQELKLSSGDKLIFAMEGGISISENPTFRLTYSGFPDEPVAVEATDTKGKTYHDSWPAKAANAS
jgi:sulfur-oxidizing protein SoxY